MTSNKIHLQDGLEGIKSIPDNSTKLLIGDPPYCTAMTHNGRNSTFTELLLLKPFFSALLKEYKRILNEEGEIYFFCDYKSYSFYYNLFIEADFNIRNMIVWDKISGPGCYYANTHELIIYCCNNNKVKKKGSNIWRMKGFASGTKATEGEKIHPTQKPLEVIERIITEGSKEGDLVVDTFSGSGTVSVGAKKLKRNSIAFEVQEKHHKNSVERLEKTIPYDRETHQ